MCGTDRYHYRNDAYHINICNPWIRYQRPREAFDHWLPRGTEPPMLAEHHSASMQLAQLQRFMRTVGPQAGQYGAEGGDIIEDLQETLHNVRWLEQIIVALMTEGTPEPRSQVRYPATAATPDHQRCNLPASGDATHHPAAAVGPAMGR